MTADDRTTGDADRELREVETEAEQLSHEASALKTAAEEIRSRAIELHAQRSSLDSSALLRAQDKVDAADEEIEVEQVNLRWSCQELRARTERLGDNLLRSRSSSEATASALRSRLGNCSESRVGAMLQQAAAEIQQHLSLLEPLERQVTETLQVLDRASELLP